MEKMKLEAHHILEVKTGLYTVPLFLSQSIPFGVPLITNDAETRLSAEFTEL